MSPIPSPRQVWLPIAGALVALAAVMALGLAGWAAQGEAIFVSMLEAGWRNCF